MVVAIVALIVALGGTAVGAAFVTKKQTKKIAANQVNKLAPGLSVASAKNADAASTASNAQQLGGVGPSGYQSRVRWALVNSAANGLVGQILAQSGGISVASGSAGFSYLDWGEDIGSKAIQVSTAQITKGFITVTPCGSSAPAATTCAPTGTNDSNHTIVRMRDSGDTTATNQIYFISVTE
jgi:predicted nucleic acid binding AN1-type Zn finger protein